MAQDFYLKAQALHEEFKKRELHYLNTERKLNCSMIWKKDLNLPLQEYLHKINQREKEADETYKNIMKQMEELDQHTNVMSLKLEKLGILQTGITAPTTPSWLQRLDSHAGSNHLTYSTHSLYATPNAFQLSLKSVSTQTENSVHCEKCNCLILTNDQSNHLLKNFPPLSSTHFQMIDKMETIQSSDSQFNSTNVLNDTHNYSEFSESRGKEHLLIPANHKNLIEQVNEEPPEQKLNVNRNNLSNKQLQLSRGSIAAHTQDHISKNKEKLIVSQSSANEKYDETHIVDAESNVDTFVSKSDVESMNNEFDFLESDTANRPPKMETQQNSRDVKYPTNHIDMSLEKVSSSVEGHPSEPKLNLKSEEQEKSALHPKSKLNAGDDKSETSGSVSGLHSPNMSVASDSDSIYEKGSPLTASAAYQALLGNTVLPKKTPKNVSDSESEDEVENALASAVQRSHVKSKSSVKPKKDKASLQSADVKPVVKPSKLSSGNKPQSKLSKSTRKVLGLDTSSGSDVEIAVKPPSEKKIDEDSDEFDFYD